MRVLFTVSSWPTHYMSMVPLGWALQSAGHEVRVLCAPSQADTVSRAGLVPVPVLGGMEVVVRNRLEYYGEAVRGTWPYPWLPLHPITGRQMSRLDDFDLVEYRREIEPVFAEQAGRSMDAAVTFARGWRPEVILHDPVSLEGLLAAKVIGVPEVMSLWGPVGTHEPDGVRIVPDDLGDWFPRYGLPAMSVDLIEHIADPCPPPVVPPCTADRLPIQYLPYNGPGAMSGWAMEPPARPRVCVAWSTALTTMSGPNSYLLPAVLRGLADLDVEVVLTATSRDAAALGKMCGPVRVLERFPLNLLLPSCDAVVHHGGAGSSMTAMWAGVPQLALTFAREQTTNGERIEAAGAGRHLLGHHASPAVIRDTVADIVETSGYRRGAADLRAELRRRPTPAEFVETLDKLARG